MVREIRMSEYRYCVNNQTFELGTETVKRKKGVMVGSSVHSSIQG